MHGDERYAPAPRSAPAWPIADSDSDWTDSVVGHTKGDLCRAITNFQFTHPELVARFSRYASIENWKAKSPANMTSSGWVIDTLEVALWGFFKYESWEEGVLAVVNLGGDSDTAGAVYGGLAGVYYGYEAIPPRWVNGMQNGGMIRDISGKFADLVPTEEPSSSWQT